MKKTRLFLASASLIVSIGSVAFSHKNLRLTAPEYYLSVNATCEVLPFATNCPPFGTVPCTVTVSPTEVNRPVFDDRDSNGQCQTPLYME